MLTIITARHGEIGHKMKSILTTGFNREVYITTPSEEIMLALTGGGLWRNPSRGFVEQQIEINIREGRDKAGSVKFCRALAHGGLTTAEAYSVLRDRDCGWLGTGHELISLSELPDRYFRDAWTRSPNGGPCYIDIKKARKLHFTYLRGYANMLLRCIANDMDHFDTHIDINWHSVKSAIINCDTPEKVKRVIPEGLRDVIDRRKAGDSESRH